MTNKMTSHMHLYKEKEEVQEEGELTEDGESVKHIS